MSDEAIKAAARAIALLDPSEPLHFDHLCESCSEAILHARRAINAAEPYIRAAENEACARIADEWCIGHNMAAPKIAAAIRARINEPDLVPPQSKP